MDRGQCDRAGLLAIALFAFKALWLTAILYALLLLVALAALLRWRRLCA